ncbi:MAG: FxLYD domain-containing protein [Chloroflexota bacterium]
MSQHAAGRSKPGPAAAVAVVMAFAAACAAAPQSPPAATITPQAATPVATPTAGLELPLEDVTLRPRPGGLGWYVAGLVRNPSDEAWREVVLHVSLVGDGQLVAEAVVPLPWTHIGPGETAPFEATFEAIGPADVVQVALASFEPASFRRARVTTREVHIVQGGPRDPHILGSIVNESGDPVELTAAVVLARDEAGEIVELVSEVAVPARLEAGERAPFVAQLESRQPVTAAEVYLDGLVAEVDVPTAFSLVGAPQMHLDAQGDPFWVGVVRNESAAPQSLIGVAGWTLEGALIGAAALSAPVPLDPGERLAFGLAEVPGIGAWMRETGGDPAVLSLSLWLTPSTAEVAGEAVPLALTVRSIEAIGGNLFLRGEVRSPGTGELERASVLAALRDTEGELLSAGWTEAAARLGPEESAEFLLVLALPMGVELAGVEYDLRAVGLRRVGD